MPNFDHLLIYPSKYSVRPYNENDYFVKNTNAYFWIRPILRLYPIHIGQSDWRAHQSLEPTLFWVSSKSAEIVIFFAVEITYTRTHTVYIVLCYSLVTADIAWNRGIIQSIIDNKPSRAYAFINYIGSTHWNWSYIIDANIFFSFHIVIFYVFLCDSWLFRSAHIHIKSFSTGKFLMLFMCMCMCGNLLPSLTEKRNIA